MSDANRTKWVNALNSHVPNVKPFLILTKINDFSHGAFFFNLTPFPERKY